MEPGNVLADKVVNEIEQLCNFGSFEGKVDFEVISDPNRMARIVETMTSGIDSDAGSESSAADPMKRKRVRSRNKIGREGTSNELNARKIHNHKKDKPWFDSYNVFNRRPPPKDAFANAEDDPGRVSKVQSGLGGGDGPDEAFSSVLVDSGSEASIESGGNHQNKSTDSGKIPTARTVKPKRQNPMKRLQRKKLNLKPKINSAKKPVGRELARQVARQAEKYLKALSQLANSDENGGKLEDSELEWNAEDDDSGCEDSEGTKTNDVEECQPALFETIAEIRNRTASSVSWNRGLLFVDQGLAYNRMARERRVWVNDKGTVVTDLSDPATDAVRLIGLSMGGLIVPKGGGNPYDYTNSYLDAMMEKYPVLRPENTSEHQDYDLVLNKVAEMFPVLVTTHYMLMGDPQLGTMAKLKYGLPLAIYLEGFSSLVCQHHLEKDYNILPFLMVNMIARLGPLFKEANPTGRLEMAHIAFKHIKKSIDSTSLPWYFRELFCRKYGICEKPDFYPSYGREREKAMMDLATLVGQPDVSSLLAQIDEYDFRKGCPSVNDLQPTKWDMYYMNIFYSRAVKHLQFGHKPDSRPNDQNLTSPDSPKEIQDEELHRILGSANRLVENQQPNEDEKNPKTHWFINLDDEID